jgi:hypothetical protein
MVSSTLLWSMAGRRSCCREDVDAGGFRVGGASRTGALSKAGGPFEKVAL